MGPEQEPPKELLSALDAALERLEAEGRIRKARDASGKLLLDEYGDPLWEAVPQTEAV